ncbi:MAG TPA: serine hydrolase, partial [Thermoanaerobaculia bacterium]|nr:serine hydrolase [Thermoanaerobaculia bacterium]
EYLTENVWKPLGMTSTRMDDPRAIIPHRVTGYVLEGGKLRRSEYIDVSSRFGGGGTRSTVDDMIRMVEGLAGGKVLKTSTRDAAWSMQPTRDGRYTRYGLGFGVVMRNGRWMVAHSGAQQETRTDLVIVPHERFAVALATNFENADLDALEDKLIEIFLGDPAPIGARANDDATQSAWRAMNDAYLYGLGYYDRYGKPMTTDARELANAFDYFKRAQSNHALAVDGAQPVSGEALTKLGSYMASVLASSKRDLDVYHREGPLRFFADYAAASPQRNFDRAFTRNIATWLADWNRVWTPELQRVDAASDEGVAALERNREQLVAATLKPDFARPLISIAEDKVRSGDAAGATRVANLAYALYPRSAAINGLLGVLTLMSGDTARAKSLLATSVSIDPSDYASAGNLLNIANFLARDAKPRAIALLEVAAELHPNNAALRARLAELRK